MSLDSIELAYLSWKTRLRGAVHHLAIAHALWESCVRVAYHCEEHDPRHEHLRAMQDNEPMSMIELLDQLRDASDKLMEAELRGKAAMKAEDEEDEEDADR